MKDYLFNPFRFIAGGKALILGGITMVLTALVGWLSHTHFPDVISLKSSPGYPFYYLLFQTFVNWLLLSSLIYGYSKVVSKSSVRALDIFGTQALARFPYLPGAFIGFSGSMERFAKYILSKTMQPDLDNSITPTDIGIAVLIIILSLLLLIWLFVLMYNAFSLSSNLKGSKAVIGLIACLIISVIAAQFINYQALAWFNLTVPHL